MKKLMKRAAIFAFVLSSVGMISAAESPRDPDKSHLVTSRAMIQDEFSGIETKPIIKAFFSWMDETRGDILILPPTDADGLFYDIAVKGEGEGNGLGVFEMDLRPDGTNLEPWSKGCRQAFYVVRVTSKDPIVKALDGEDRQIMAFTFTGCAYKFIAVVADRMRSEDMLYTTMLHELGHMWGLPDNKEGNSSVMAGTYPGAPCITKRDLQEVYVKWGKANAVPEGTGCLPIEVTKK